MSGLTSRTPAWEWLALAAATFVVVALPVYFVLGPGGQPAAVAAPATAEFVGSANCRECHEPEYDSWTGSHHDLAMDIATEDSVLGDFNDAEFTLFGVTSRFYRKDGGFYVHTNGPGGEMGDFEITHTFGWFPLQQYLVPFPGGRLQTLPIAWDSREDRWFRVPPVEDLDPDDWLYWTNAAQNWNGMCAQCHSTNLDKNYDPETETYATTWSDIDVGCEACHGPGSLHVAWAEIPDIGRPAAENVRLVKRTSGITPREHVELCAPCHSRRAALADLEHTESDFLDTFLPSLLEEGLYFADGQILDEVYVYGSFTQSKMFQRDVQCSDCHDVHSVKPVLEDNALCLQCHRAAQYDSYEHHFHKQAGEAGEPIRGADGEVLFDVGTGALCRECHMPGRTYMGNDYRPDHSFRVPDPALNAAIGSPDACLRCHVDKDTAWSQETVVEWYGPGRSPHYGEVIARGRRGAPDAGDDLRALAGDDLYPVLVRATALSLLAAYPGRPTEQAYEIALSDDEAILRRTAVAGIRYADPGRLAKTLAQSLEDPVRTVRIAAASRLAGELSEYLAGAQRQRFETVLAEYEDAMRYSADFAFGRYNLGNLYNELGRTADAIDSFQKAIAIDDAFYPAKVNLALLYNRQGENRKAERLFRDVLAAQPELHDVAYSLALLLVEMQQYREAVAFLEQAADGLPQRARIQYNLGLLQQQLQNAEAAEDRLRRALELEPDNLDFQYALADHYIKRGLLEQAIPVVERMMATHPENPIGAQMMDFIRRASGR
ncbi:MAG: tetratricopeptide repeat protein [Xanthomonadales bacterium]